MIKLKIDGFEARALTVADWEATLTRPEEEFVERSLRATMFKVNGAPWPGPGASRDTAPLDVPLPVVGAIVTFHEQQAGLDGSEVESAHASAELGIRGGTITIRGKRFEVATPTVAQFTNRMTMCGKREQQATLMLLRDNLRSVDGAPVSNLHTAWPFDLLTTRVLVTFVSRLCNQDIMGGKVGNGVWEIVDEEP